MSTREVRGKEGGNSYRLCSASQAAAALGSFDGSPLISKVVAIVKGGVMLMVKEDK